MRAIAIAFIGFTAFIVVFALQNTGKINLKILFWKIEGYPVGLLMVFALLLGAAMAVIFFWPQVSELSKENRKLTKTLHRLKLIEGHNSNDDPEGIEFEEDTNPKSFFNE